mgnify:CR=1 FL=1
MPARLLSIPFIIGIISCLYVAWESDESYAIYILPLAIILVIIYILQPQIDWWWYSKRPPELDPPLIRMLDRFIGFYAPLNPSQKLRFRQRVAMFMMAHEFIPKGFEEVPEDVQCVVAANAVQMTFGKEEYLFPKFEQIVVYPLPFPSPQFPKRRHASEIYLEDGVLLFSAKQLIAGTFNPAKNFNICLYEYAKVYRITYPEEVFPTYDNFIWEKLEAISGLRRAYIEAYIGLEKIDVQAVSIALFFSRPIQFKAILPQAYEIIGRAFHLDPANIEFPVVRIV